MLKALPRKWQYSNTNSVKFPLHALITFTVVVRFLMVNRKYYNQFVTDLRKE